MTEVPEYLLLRSRERREALGLAPKGGAAPSEGAAPSPSEGSSPAAPASAPAAAAASAAPAAARPAISTLPTVPSQPIHPPWPKSGIPVWMMPVLLALPLWAIVYMGAFGARGGAELTVEQLGAQVYATAGCGSCHGAAGQGVGAFPPLAGGEAALTFPDEADHIAWVETGSGPFRGQPYGDPGRPGGQRIATSGGMPGFSSVLTPEEIQAVVAFERSGL